MTEGGDNVEFEGVRGEMDDWRGRPAGKSSRYLICLGLAASVISLEGKFITGLI